jgi:hypothetical protein
MQRMRPAQPWGDVVRELNQQPGMTTWTVERLRASNAMSRLAYPTSGSVSQRRSSSPPPSTLRAHFVRGPRALTA